MVFNVAHFVRNLYAERLTAAHGPPMTAISEASDRPDNRTETREPSPSPL